MSEKIDIKTEEDNVLKTQEQIQKENKRLSDALSAFTPMTKKEEVMDPKVLERLKSKMTEDKPQSTEPTQVIKKQDVSINMAFVGVGQGGSRIAETFYKLGYDAAVINTSAQDLKFIDLLPQNKYLIEGTLGGTGKDRNLSSDLFDANQDDIRKFLAPVLEGNDMVYLAASGGGGTGGGSVEVMVPLLYTFGKPVGVIFILPKATDDAQSKKNSIETLASLAKLASEDVISSLVVVDNARIEHIYGGLSQAQFWQTANNAIAEPMHLFNYLTAQASKFTSLDPSDFGKIISAGDCSIYGVVEVEDYMEEVALADAAINSLSGNMLAEGFDLTQTRVGGVIVVGSEKVMSELPSLNIDYLFHIVSEKTGGASIYRGVYSDDSMGDTVKVYSWFAGLGLPHDRISNLQKESKEQEKVMLEKDKSRAGNMNLDLGENKTASITDQIHRKIQSKNSGFNKLQGGVRTSIIDKRNRGR